jgi:hypothetical protein
VHFCQKIKHCFVAYQQNEWTKDYLQINCALKCNEVNKAFSHRKRICSYKLSGLLLAFHWNCWFMQWYFKLRLLWRFNSWLIWGRSIIDPACEPPYNVSTWGAVSLLPTAVVSFTSCLLQFMISCVLNSTHKGKLIDFLCYSSSDMWQLLQEQCVTFVSVRMNWAALWALTSNRSVRTKSNDPFLW